MASVLATPVPLPALEPLETPEAPVEVRAARAEERAQAWELQRTAFNLPEQGPPPHPGHDQELRVVVRDGRVVSCLTLIHAELSLGGALVAMGGIRHVATHPEEQNQGYASALMRDTLLELQRRGVATSVLFPFSFRYYRKFGYELAGNHCHVWCRPNCIPAYVERRECRPVRTEDVAALAAYYAGRCRDSACSLARPEARWARICGDPGLKVFLAGPDTVTGYAVTREERDAYGGRVLRVLDMSAGTPAAWRALLGALSQSPVESIEWLARAGDLAASGLMRSPAPLREGFKPRCIATVRPMIQLRIVDLRSALQSRLSTFPPGQYRLALHVHDDLIPANTQPLLIQGTPSGAEVRELHRIKGEEPCLEMDVRVFSQLFSGFMSPSEAASQELVRASSAEALDLAEQLFPAGEPFVAELDRF